MVKHPNLVSRGTRGGVRSGSSGASAGGRPPSASHPTPASLLQHPRVREVASVGPRAHLPPDPGHSSGTAGPLHNEMSVSGRNGGKAGPCMDQPCIPLSHYFVGRGTKTWLSGRTEARQTPLAKVANHECGYSHWPSRCKVKISWCPTISRYGTFTTEVLEGFCNRSVGGHIPMGVRRW